MAGVKAIDRSHQIRPGASVTASPVGRTKLAATLHRENRRILNKYNEQLTQKALAKALQGDSTAILACSNLILAANSTQEPKK